MTKYRVELEKIEHYVVEVEAETTEDARQRAIEMASNWSVIRIDSATGARRQTDDVVTVQFGGGV